MNIETLMEMWSADSKIDEINLDVSSIESAAMHAKYLEIYSLAKMRLKKKELDMAILKKDKWMYYNGKMTKEQMDNRDWRYDPFDGMAKPLKGDMEQFYKTDPDISTLQLQIDCQAVLVDACKEILDTIRWRSSTIKNILEWKKFQAGI